MITKSHETVIALSLLLALAIESWILAAIVVAYGIYGMSRRSA